MKITALIPLLILLAYSAVAQNKELVLKFKPSFIPSSILTVKEFGNKATIKLQYYVKKGDDTVSIMEEKKLTKSDVDSLMSFFSKYKFKIKGNIDTLGTFEVERNGKKTAHYSISWGHDGITVNGKLRNEDNVKNFAFWSPKAGTDNHTLILKLLGIMDNNFKRKQTKRYLAGLKKYF